MGIYLGTSSNISGPSGEELLKINTGTHNNLIIDTYGNNKKRPIGFIAGQAASEGWVQQNVSPYKYTNFDSVSYNVDNCFNTSLARFTAPQNGYYIFTASQYNYKPSGANTDYHHPMFFVNGSASVRRGGRVMYRMRGRGVTVGYAFDSQISEGIYLLQGDYVEFWSYTITTVNFYRTYSHFAGFLVG